MGRRGHATYADLLRLPDHVVGEIIEGVLYTSPRPAPAHALASSSIGGDLEGPFGKGRGGPGGWWILDEPELHLGEDVLVPDLDGWRRERMPRMPSGPAFELAPDWVCEVLSPRTARLDRTRKMAVYARAGVPYVWLVDPLLNTLEVCRLAAEGYTTVAAHSRTDRVRAAPFDAIEIDLAGWWSELVPENP